MAGQFRELGEGACGLFVIWLPISNSKAEVVVECIAVFSAPWEGSASCAVDHTPKPFTRGSTLVVLGWYQNNPYKPGGWGAWAPGQRYNPG